ncbi:MAG TPA: translocation/assembly module TamB domain-containing protein, partial [Cytophagaceae bacterium]
ADGSLSTNLGKLDTDINLKINDSLSPKSYYKGHLTTYNFNLGQLIDRPEVKTIEMDGNIEGKGFSLEEAELKLDAEIKEIGYKNYNYKNIITNAQLSDEHFIGEISVRDTNLTFYAKGNVDLRPGRNIFNINSHIEKFNLKPLHLSDVETLIKTDVNLNFRGLTMDDIVGDITFANTYLLYKDHKEIFLDSLIAFTNKIDGQRTFTINSDLLTVNSHGNFDLSTLGLDLQNLYKEYKLAITENKTQVEAYYAQKPKTTKEKYHTDFSINIIDLNAILAIYVPGLYFSPGTIITGNFTSGHTSTLNLNTYIDTFYYKENVFYKTNIELATSKITDSSDVLAMAYVRSKGQHIYGFTETENFVFDGVWDMDSVKFNTSVDQKRSNNKAYLKGTLSLQEDHKTLQLQDSYLNLLNKKWRITESSTIQFLPNEILVKLLEVSNNNQTITFKGPISKTDDKESYLDIKNFQIENLNPLIEESANIKGSLTGNIVIKDIFENLDINGNINLLNLHVDDFLIGNVDGLSRWDGGKKQLDIKVGVVRENDKIIDLKGYLKPGLNETKEEVNFIATLDNADLSILSPLLKGVMSDLSGNVTGVFDIQGSIRNLKLKGRGDVNDGKFKVDYLGTTYTFNDYIYLDDNLIGFKKLLLKDADGNQAIIDGGIYHDNFRDFMVSIKGYMNNFQVLNTTEKDNNLFYGKAMVSGDVEMLGAFTNLEIKANAISEKGTKIFIPLNSYSEIEQQNYIRFTSFKDAKEKDKEAHKDHIDLSGISMDFNLEITPDAYCEIIFDKKAGDIIRGYGKGNLKLKIDTRGDFNMYGNYTITEGAYNFTLAGIVNKAFKIEPNSTISWMGDPYEGILDIKAIHKLDVSLRPLLDSIEASKPANQKKYPVNVVLDVEGNLLSPEISLDIDILRYGDLGTYVAEFESKIQNNEQELNRQVFSLMVLGSLSRENSFSGISSNSSTNNLSELLSNQLSSWLSQVDDNLQIDIDLNSMDKDILNNFQLRLSYTLLDGRLRITRDGNFQNVNNANEAQVSNLAGEWTVEY